MEAQNTFLLKHNDNNFVHQEKSWEKIIRKRKKKETSRKLSFGLPELDRLTHREKHSGHTTKMEPKAYLNLILLGKKCAGKSMSGNTILGRKAFISKSRPGSVTPDSTAESGTVDGFPVNVYDTTGFCDPELSEDEIQQIKNVFQKCESGHCVFLLVIKVDIFTKEERKTVEKIEKLLGEERLNKTWILFTRGDELEDENMTIQEFLDRKTGLKTLVKKYDQRYHVFNNNKRRGASDQARLLLIKILQRSLGLSGECFKRSYRLIKSFGLQTVVLNCISVMSKWIRNY
uniref:AIG1-type G domain-containing protein n=1 Tax=Cyprinus carpio TaxID=7962 RepID=A0A8C2GYW3_CYPCA